MEQLSFAIKEQAQEAARARLGELCSFYGSTPVLMMFAGGSSLALLDGLELREHEGPIAVTVTDERVLGPQNFAELASTPFAKKVLAQRGRFIDTTPKQGETPQELASRFEKQLRAWREENPEGVVIITEGFGADGHTAGVMPYPEDPERFSSLFDGGDRWAAGYDAGDKNPHPLRVTVTLPFLREVDHAVAYAHGEEKANALARLEAEEGELFETPARVMREMKDVRLFSAIPSYRIVS